MSHEDRRRSSQRGQDIRYVSATGRDVQALDDIPGASVPAEIAGHHLVGRREDCALVAPVRGIAAPSVDEYERRRALSAGLAVNRCTGHGDELRRLRVILG